MQKGLIGKKIGMTQLFDEKGNVLPVTLVEAIPCVVVQKKTMENDGYEAVQVGFGEVKAQRLNKPMKGHFAKADVAPKKVLKEFRLDDTSALNVGDILKADTFAAGDRIDVSGISKGKGRRRYETLEFQPFEGKPWYRSGCSSCRLWVHAPARPAYSRARSWQVTSAVSA